MLLIGRQESVPHVSRVKGEERMMLILLLCLSECSYPVSHRLIHLHWRAQMNIYYSSASEIWQLLIISFLHPGICLAATLTF